MWRVYGRRYSLAGLLTLMTACAITVQVILEVKPSFMNSYGTFVPWWCVGGIGVAIVSACINVSFLTADVCRVCRNMVAEVRKRMRRADQVCDSTCRDKAE